VSKTIVKHQGGAVVEKTGEFHLALPDGITEAKYRGIVDKARSIITKTDELLRKTCADVMPRVWDLGAFMKEAAAGIDLLADSVLAKFAADVDGLPSARAGTMKFIRTGVRMAKYYAKERVIELAQAGATDTHFVELTNIEDGRERRSFEEKIIKHGITVAEIKQEIRNKLATKGIEGAGLSPKSVQRHKQAATVKKAKRDKRISEPGRQIEYMLTRLQGLLDDLSDTYTSLRGVENIDGVDRPALLPPLHELISQFSTTSTTVESILEAARKAVELCEAADKAEDKKDK
jgi:hypothetical protein